jgi:hypothetical protein
MMHYRMSKVTVNSKVFYKTCESKAKTYHVITCKFRGNQLLQKSFTYLVTARLIGGFAWFENEHVLSFARLHLFQDITFPPVYNNYDY